MMDWLSSSSVLALNWERDLEQEAVWRHVVQQAIRAPETGLFPRIRQVE